MSDSGLALEKLQLAQLRQELLAPVGVMVAYTENLREAVGEQGLEEFLSDFDRISESAVLLQNMVQVGLDPKNEAQDWGDDLESARRKLRHDLRTPLNAIKGYGEMLMEDLEDLDEADLVDDLARTIKEAEALSEQIETIVSVSGSSLAEEQAAGTDQDDTSAANAQMFDALLNTMTPNSQAVDQRLRGRILVVDDMEANRDMLMRRLEKEGHQVKTVSGGREALALLPQEDFDLVLLDLMMPDMNGFEVLSKMKADAELRSLPVIMVSALDEMDSVIRCIEAGAEDYLSKPINAILLSARIASSLEKLAWHRREQEYLEQLRIEKEAHEKLLNAVLPKQVIGRLNRGEKVIADRFEEVTVLFSDLVGFTRASSYVEPDVMVTYLNALFSEFDRVAHAVGVEKVKMIGDAYMAVSGAPEPRADHAIAMAEMALGMREAVTRVNANSPYPLDIRIGMHSGPVVAGIIGQERFLYDIWGDTVNVASRLESHGVAHHIQISAATARHLSGKFDLEERGMISVKGKGRLKAFFLRGPLVN